MTLWADIAKRFQADKAEPEEEESTRDTSAQENAADVAHIEQLIEAAKTGQLREVQHLCEVVGVDPDQRGYMGWTAAHWAAREGHIAILEYLLQAGANLDTLDRRGDCLLHKAAANGQHDTCAWLLAHNFNALTTNNNGMTPIDMALERAGQTKDAAAAHCAAALAHEGECTF
ncbi:hypothetical protein ACHHYP_02042 [Achlya hypogyna]|uniref:Uncharacterized protein n=1 Tax=Achlya hypogyna TaxID=1202772 RepID=A0A1V9ZSJ5_ACHHY|nr:hypothetical protein ACHHYP_02042 [Achlya hypogyna]